ncbi:uncharacterized protein SCHCODRAFT_02321106 [Schizophyllum commune H4-8]|uniref:uncharacterized protein n=1 Tax=Schizophyllum commune (strain H4-8 / FGSC 9210) TaxID=578458 RepID=UPI00215E18EE|nr:uncharacterized protein SCHCODRAFT_02321106 [Schizophyllum commune H4-8]KAI5891488.1 hypothetical protein SCHCODRAFT_02321106 [Schizophyllum commune H4-8]
MAAALGIRRRARRRGPCAPRGPPPSSSAHARNVALHAAGSIVKRGRTRGRALVPNALGRRRWSCPLLLNNSISISHPSMTLPTRSTMLRDVHKQGQRLRAPLQAGAKMAGELAVAQVRHCLCLFIVFV